MKITQHRKLNKENQDSEEFECKQCGCKFSADHDEYYVDAGTCFTSSSSLTYSYGTNATDAYVCSCPECHKIVTKTKNRLVTNPCITLTGTGSTTTVSSYCKNCSNHPDNGGSGNCNCTIGIMGQVTC